MTIIHLFYLSGESLTDEDLLELGRNPTKYSIDLTPDAWTRLQTSREYVDDIVSRDVVKYGINTGFGNFASIKIAPGEITLLQKNLILSHAAGIGEPLTTERTRMLLILRINVLAKGYSGISVETVKRLLVFLNGNYLSEVPQQGTLGASGDLAPLAHLALGMLGIGKMWDPNIQRWDEAKDVISRNNLTAIELGAKEGLALINGTQFITALGAEAGVRAAMILKTADIVAALSIEVLMGSKVPLSAEIHLARPHTGQRVVAERFRQLLDLPSELNDSHKNCSRVQDSYTLRCIPQVHGVVHDTIEFSRKIFNCEINSATDNPMVFCTHDGENKILSGGNFHGEYPAKACDFLCISINEIANMSERRIERLVNPDLSGMPAFLVGKGGLNSGFMIAHCTAAALTSESKTLCFPASSDTISTSATKEDHVSMGGWAARKALRVVENVEVVVAIELMLACQALEFRRPLKTTPPLESVHSLVRTLIPPWECDRYMKPDIDAITAAVRNGDVIRAVSGYLKGTR
eukprot:TRINITY_DN3356_c0_g1_i1.p1 TRINITY_DN3356_c0_g1~~TRINITY_DN3356_c0_g1_i1.p1  ORF type:complete len:521 (+),score=62.80 TRINITY_DN3356_c0_g1_i1:90-1652(+)